VKHIIVMILAVAALFYTQSTVQKTTDFQVARIMRTIQNVGR
jgi:hypothetical protein